MMETTTTIGSNYPYHPNPNKPVNRPAVKKPTMRRRCLSECLTMDQGRGGLLPDTKITATNQQPLLRFKPASGRPTGSASLANPTKNGKCPVVERKLIPLVESRQTNVQPQPSTTTTTSDLYEKEFRICEYDIFRENELAARKINQQFMAKFNTHLAKVKLASVRDAELKKQIVNGDFTPARRTRARSESEPHEIYKTNTANYSFVKCPKTTEVSSVKRLRDDRPVERSAKQPHRNGTTPLGTNIPVNPNHTRILNRVCSAPRRARAASAIDSRLRCTRSGLLGKTNKQTKTVQMPVPTTVDTYFDVLTNGRATEGSVPVVEEPIATVKPTVHGGDSDSDGSSLGDNDDFDDIPDDNCCNSDSDDSVLQSLTSTDTDTGIIKSDYAVETADCVLGHHVETAPLAASLFPNVPPYITFAGHDEKGPTMPFNIARVLKWKVTKITPIVIRKVLANTGFRLLRKTNDWMGIWGKHMKSPCFKTLRSHQKMNHIPGSFQIGRKDRLWRNLQSQMGRHGKKEFGFMPRTYVMPSDCRQLRRSWPRYSQRNTKWIIKPPASARGAGIKVVNRWSQVPKRIPMIVQKYIERPLLINGSKFDLRLYVLVTSVNPLKIYMHTDGLARFASVKYSEKAETLHDRYMHLTNYSINKLSANYSKNEDAAACQGHKWTVKSLWSYLSSQGVNTDRLWGALRNLVIRTIISGEHSINHLTKSNVGSKYNCFELFGIDVILDSELTPWLLEVNISPSLHSSSPLDLHVKGPLVTAVLNTAMFQVPPRITIEDQQTLMADQNLKGNLCYDKRLYVTNLSKMERIKHFRYANQNLTREEYLDSILDSLTPDDVRCLILCEDELGRCSPLERIFPTFNSHKYLKYTETARYYNRLLDAWEHRYSCRREDGLSLLRRCCDDSEHLSVAPQTKGKHRREQKVPYISRNYENSLVTPFQKLFWLSNSLRKYSAAGNAPKKDSENNLSLDEAITSGDEDETDNIDNNKTAVPSDNSSKVKYPPAHPNVDNIKMNMTLKNGFTSGSVPNGIPRTA